MQSFCYHNPSISLIFIAAFYSHKPWSTVYSLHCSHLTLKRMSETWHSECLSKKTLTNPTIDLVYNGIQWSIVTGQVTVNCYQSKVWLQITVHNTECKHNWALMTSKLNLSFVWEEECNLQHRGVNCFFCCDCIQCLFSLLSCQSIPL